MDRPLAASEPSPSVSARSTQPSVARTTTIGRVSRTTPLPLRSDAGGAPSGSSARCRRSTAPPAFRATDPPEAAETPARDPDRVTRRHHPRERDRALAGEVAQVENLGLAGRRGERGQAPPDRCRCPGCRSARRGRRPRAGREGTRSTPVLASGIQPWAYATSGGATRASNRGGVAPGVSRRAPGHPRMAPRLARPRPVATGASRRCPPWGRAGPTPGPAEAQASAAASTGAMARREATDACGS